MTEDMTLGIHYADDTTLVTTVFKKPIIATNELNKA